MPKNRRYPDAKGEGASRGVPPEMVACESLGSMDAPTDNEILKSKSGRSARPGARALIGDAQAEPARVPTHVEAIAKPRVRLPRHSDLRRQATLAAKLGNDALLREIDASIAGYVRRLDKLTRSIEKISATKPSLSSSQVMGWHAASDNLKSLLAQAQRERIAYVETAGRQAQAMPRIGWEDGTAWNDRIAPADIEEARRTLVAELTLHAPLDATISSGEDAALPTLRILHAMPERADPFDPCSVVLQGKSFGIGPNGAVVGTPWTIGGEVVVPVSNCLS